jgi:hypothetical protein
MEAFILVQRLDCHMLKDQSISWLLFNKGERGILKFQPPFVIWKKGKLQGFFLEYYRIQ